jgi:hypothetical protein
MMNFSFKYLSILLLISVSVCLLFNSCKKEEGGDTVLGDGAPPVLLLNGQDVYEDTIKVSVNPVLDISFTINDDLSKHQLSMSKLDGAIVYYEGSVLNNSTIELNSRSSGTLEFRALEPGVHSFFLSLEDENTDAVTVLIEITAIENLEPTAVIVAEQVDEVANYHVRIDAGNSFDRDQAWGGAIQAYEFNLVDIYKVETERSELDYIYPGPGTYSLELRVKDNDGRWSDIDKIVIEVE